MKSIWMINHYAEPPIGGKYTRHFMFAKELIKRGYKVKIFTASTIHNTPINHREAGKKYIEKNIDGVDFVFISTTDYFGNSKGRIKNMLDYYFGVQSVTKGFERPDVIYTSGPHTLTWWASRKIAKRTGARFVVETRDLWPQTFVSMGKFKENHPVAKILYAMEKSIYESADALIFTMEGGADYIKHRGLTTGQVTSINNGVDLEAFDQSVIDEAFRDEYLDSDLFKVIYTGAIGNANEVDKIVKAAKILEKEYPSVVFLIYGDGYLKGELEEMVRDEHIGNVHFRGKLLKQQIPYVLSKSNCNIISGKSIDLYKYGTSLNKLFEYFAAGKPILSNLKANYNLINRYEAGIVVEDNRPEALAKGVESILKMSEQKRNQLGENARVAAKDYDFKVLTDQLVKVLEGDLLE